MAKISSKNIAEAVHKATLGKSKSETDAVLKRVAEMLKAKRMLGKGEEILDALQNILDKSTGTVRARVTSAKTLKTEERKKLEEEIKKKYKAESVVSEFFENKELLGGTRVEVRDEVTDTTYKNKLNQLEKFLIQAK